MNSPIVGPPQSPLPQSPNRTPRQMASAGPRLSFTGRVDVDAVQQQLARTPAFGSHPGLAHIDLVGATSFDLVGLIVLLAALFERVSATGRTKFRLPSSGLARHVLRMWAFPAAASVVTQSPFRTLVERPDLEYFGETWPRRTEHSDANPTRYLTAQKPFGLSAYRIADLHSVLQIMDEEVEHWRSYAVIKLLQRLLPGKSVDEIARVIIQELVANILQHPGASLAISGARLDVSQDSANSRPPSLIIALWDDGASIIDALRFYLQLHKATDPPLPGTRDRFLLEPGSWSNGRLIYTSDWSPGPDAADPEVLLASLYIGLRPVIGHGQTNRADSPTVTGGPEGLLPLYRVVLNDFSGSLEIQSKNSSLTLTSNGKPGHYRIRLAECSEMPPITGNLVVVKLPVIDA